MPVQRLVDRRPQPAGAELIEALLPPPRFAEVRFATYRPDPAHPSQAEARGALHEFAAQLPNPPRRSFWRRGPDARPSGIYLDGGFGVGKTHLLASLWHAAPAPKAYATFVELTHLVGAFGFAATVEALSGHRVLAIDEFELDDPGDTVLVSTLLGKLVEHGVRLAATSNTLPERLGAGRFAAEDFLREIQGLAAQFAVRTIDGEDYRHRGLAAAPAAYDGNITTAAAAVPGASADDFGELLDHLSDLHPVRYAALVEGVSAVFLQNVREITDERVALRWVVFVDRLYDAETPIVASGIPLDAVFPSAMLSGAYEKKYRRAASRMVALARDGVALTAATPSR